MAILEVLNVKKRIRNQIILDDISFECRTGEILGIFGKNGSGKSTLLKIIFGTVKCSSIKLLVDNKEINTKKVIKSNLIGYLPQDTFLPKNITVRDIIPAFFEEGDDQDKIFYAPRVGDFEKRKIGLLSMGERRYFELLLLSNLDHPFLMLDEPFSMIEPLYMEIIKNKLIELKKRKGIIITDHYYSDVLQISDTNFLIKRNIGKIDIFNKNDLRKHGYIN